MQSGTFANRGVRLSIVAIWAALSLLAIHLFIDLNRSYDDAQERGNRLALTYVRLVAEHAAATFGRADLILERAVELPRPADLAAAKSLSPGRRQELETALVALQDVVQRFPDSEYARDATLKIDLTMDHLAGKEMEVGRYYLFQRDYIGAINRFRVVVEQYQRTSQIAEALERLTEAYYALGLDKEAQTAAAVLGANYPGSPWYEDAYNLLKGRHLKPEEDKGSWISRAFDKVL